MEALLQELLGYFGVAAWDLRNQIEKMLDPLVGFEQHEVRCDVALSSQPWKQHVMVTMGFQNSIDCFGCCKVRVAVNPRNPLARGSARQELTDNAHFAPISAAYTKVKRPSLQDGIPLVQD